jgi:hypothetical protein
MAKSRMRGKNMRAHDHDNKLDQDCQNAPSGDGRTTTNMTDAAQDQEAVVLSLIFSGYVATDTKPGSTEASSGLEDARGLLDISSSSNSEDMRGVIRFSWRRCYVMAVRYRITCSYKVNKGLANEKKQQC